MFCAPITLLHYFQEDQTGGLFCLPPSEILKYCKNVFSALIIYIEMILECDWSISVQLIPNSSDKSAKICNKSAKICNKSAKICNNSAKICNNSAKFCNKRI